MANLSRSQIASLARGAGFTGNDVDIAVAVALAESGGNPRAHNATPPDNSYGLWQINMLGALGPDRRKRLDISSNDALYDPATNARAAYLIWQGSGWKAWTTYTRGTYKKYMTGDNGGDTVAPTPVAAGLDPMAGIGASINSFGETFMKAFASFGAVIFAVVLLILGIVILMRDKVGAVIPGGKLAKVAKVAKGVSS